MNQDNAQDFVQVLQEYQDVSLKLKLRLKQDTPQVFTANTFKYLFSFRNIVVKQLDLSFCFLKDDFFENNLLTFTLFNQVQKLTLDFNPICRFPEQLLRFHLEQKKLELCELSFCGTRLDDQSIRSLGKLVQFLHITRLNLCATNTKVHSLELLTKAMFDQKQIKFLNLSSLDLADQETSNEYVRAISQIMVYLFTLESLEELDLSGTCLPDKALMDIKAVYTQLNQQRDNQRIKLKTLRLNKCGLQDSSLPVLEQIIIVNSKLQHIELRGNRFSYQLVQQRAKEMSSLRDNIFIDCSWNVNKCEVDPIDCKVSFFPPVGYKVLNQQVSSYRKDYINKGLAIQKLVTKFHLDADKSWIENRKHYPTDGNKQTSLIDIAPQIRSDLAEKQLNIRLDVTEAELLNQVFVEKEQSEDLEQQQLSVPVSNGELSYDIETHEVEAPVDTTDVVSDLQLIIQRSQQQAGVTQNQTKINKPYFKEGNHALMYDMICVLSFEEQLQQNERVFIHCKQCFREELIVNELINYKLISLYYTLIVYPSRIVLRILQVLDTQLESMVRKIQKWQMEDSHPITLQPLEYQDQIDITRIPDPEELLQAIKEQQYTIGVIAVMLEKIPNTSESNKIVLQEGQYFVTKFRIEEQGVRIITNETNYFLFFDASFNIDPIVENDQVLDDIVAAWNTSLLQEMPQELTQLQQDLGEEAQQQTEQPTNVSLSDSLYTFQIIFKAEDWRSMNYPLIVAQHSERLGHKLDEDGWKYNSMYLLTVDE